MRASIAVANRLSCSTACGIFWTRDQIHVPYIGRWFLNHWTTREVPLIYSLFTIYLCFRQNTWHVYTHAKKKCEYRNIDSSIIYKIQTLKTASIGKWLNINREMTKLQLIYLIDYFAFIKVNEAVRHYWT